MKKLFLGAAIAMSSLAFAQQFGAKTGVNVSAISDDSGLDNNGMSSSTKSKVGAYVGVFMNAPIAKDFSIQPELLYSLEGNKNDVTLSGTKSTVKTHLHMINIPVMFQYNVTPEFYLEAGPQFGFIADAKNKFSSDNSTIDNLGKQYFPEDAKDSYNTFNFSLGAGAGYYFTPNIGVTARYMAGLSDLIKDNSGDARKSGVFSAGLAYKF